MSDLARQHRSKVFQGLSLIPIDGQLNRPICERYGLSPNDDFRLSPQRSQVGRFTRRFIGKRPGPENRLTCERSGLSPTFLA